MRSIQKLVLALVLLFIPIKAVFANEAVEQVLEATSPPVGVVFEIMEWQEERFVSPFVEVENYSQQLKAKHADIQIAVVSHGREQFSLLKENSTTQSGLHDLTKALVQSGVKVEVCATHASWNGKSEQDFAEHVGVVDRAPEAIREYVEKGYVLIRL